MATILIIEDESVVQDMLTRALELAGYMVVPFSDAEAALETVDFDKIDLIITDLAMPMRGEEAIQIIRSSNITIPIIVLSGFLQPGDEVLLKSMGVNKIFRKPIHLQEFHNAITELLSTN